jgi:hypothetical protein
MTLRTLAGDRLPGQITQNAHAIELARKDVPMS